MKDIKTMAAMLLILLLGMAIDASAKGERVPKIYAFGFAASFNDSTVYITDIQEIDSAWVDSKSKFLLERDSYSSQLKNYLQGINQPNRTCIISYALKRKDAEKKFLKLKKRYSAANHYDVRVVRPDQFRFRVVEPNVIITEEKTLTKAETKAQRKAQKRARKEAKEEVKKEAKKQ